jgi:oligoendopeptidase F
MSENLPSTPEALIHWTWAEIEPHYRSLQACQLSETNLVQWLTDWSRLGEKVDELYARLSVATSINTADKQADTRMRRFLESVFPNVMAAEQQLKGMLLASGIEPQGFEIPLRNMRSEADLFRQDNLALLAEERKYAIEYDKICGAQTVNWRGAETTLTRLAMVFETPEREQREKAWRLKAERQLADRAVINALWQKFMDIRARIAQNAGKPSFREYAWQQKLRFDYSPQDCKSFLQAIEQVGVPAATRIYEKGKHLLGLPVLRPWDLVDGWFSRPSPPPGYEAPRPFQTIDELKRGVSAIFHQVDPVLGGYFDHMVAEGLTDLENRKNKAPGAFCTSYSSVRKPFVFVNAVGTHADVATTLHESGHAFHVFETAGLPYLQQLNVPMEFAEVASMGMELLASPYLTKEYGGFYTQAEAACARIEHLEGMILFWPFMAVVDAFQQWVYENPQQGRDPRQCNGKWGELWERFIPGVDWSGLEQFRDTGWHRKLHIHQLPFYYVEYGLAQLGAVQIFGHALQDQRQAVADYRHALSLGGTVTLPELFRAGGAHFGFDVEILKQSIDLMENVITELEAQQ